MEHQLSIAPPDASRAGGGSGGGASGGAAAVLSEHEQIALGDDVFAAGFVT